MSAWDTNFIGKLAVLGSLVMLAGAVLLFLPNPPELPVPLPMLLLAASGFTALMAVFEFIDHHSHTSIGLWLTLIGGDRRRLRRVRDGRPDQDAVEHVRHVSARRSREVGVGRTGRPTLYTFLTAAVRLLTDALASPNSIEVLGSKKSSFSIPAKPVFMLRLSTTTAVD